MAKDVTIFTQSCEVAAEDAVSCQTDEPQCSQLAVHLIQLRSCRNDEVGAEEYL